jgi:hypothetical protein
VRAAAFAICILLSGCAWSPETRVEEAAFAVVHAADTAQTMQIERHPQCYAEVGMASIAGDHPSTAGVLAWSAVTEAIHLGITNELEVENTPRWLRRAWQTLSFTASASSVGHNFSIGIRLGSVRQCH